MRTLDAGTMGGDTGWGFRIIMFGVTIGGIFVISTLIGVLTAGVEGKLEELRKGRSYVIESGHTVILGWSSQVFSIIPELVIANQNQKKGCIVVMAEKDKVEMEDQIRNTVGDTHNTRVVCRTGSPININDLELVSLASAKSIIILSEECENPDAEAVKTMLAITNNPHRRSEPYHIVAEIRDPKNMEVSRMVGKDEVEIVLVGNLISRIIAQTCRQSGLSVIYTELLDFGGDEIYFKEEPTLVGKTFGDCLLAYEDSAVIGLHHPGSLPQLNPPMDTILQTGDRLIAISEDDDTIRLSGLKDLGIEQNAIHLEPAHQSAPERSLILGWNWKVPSIINELDNYVANGSSLLVVSNIEEGESEIDRLCQPKNQVVTYQLGDTTDRRTLDSLHIEEYSHVIILCYDNLAPQAADAHTLITLLHLREIADQCGHPFSIVSEMLDNRNRDLAEITRADDFIVSDKIISLLLSQVSENKYLNAVFTDIFDPEGSEIYLKPASDYVTLNTPINFYTVVEAARRRNAIAIGYRIKAQASDAEKAYGIVVNPDKSQKVAFSKGDKIVVIAED